MSVAASVSLGSKPPFAAVGVRVRFGPKQPVPGQWLKVGKVRNAYLYWACCECPLPAHSYLSPGRRECLEVSFPKASCLRLIQIIT